MARRNPWEQTGFIAPTDSRVVTDDPLSKLTEEGASGFWQWMQNQTAYAKAEEATDKANKFKLRTKQDDQEFALRKLQEQAEEARLTESQRQEFERTQTKYEAMNSEVQTLSELSLNSPYEAKDRLIAFRAREDVPDYLIPSIEATIQNTTNRIERKEQRETILEKLRYATTPVGINEVPIDKWDKLLNTQDANGRFYLSPSDKITMDELRSKTESQLGMAGGKIGLEWGYKLSERWLEALALHQDVMDMGGYKNSDGTVNTKAQALAEKRITLFQNQYENFASQSDPQQLKLVQTIRKWEEENGRQYDTLSEEDKNNLQAQFLKEITKEEVVTETAEEKLKEVLGPAERMDYHGEDIVEVKDLVTGKKSKMLGRIAKPKENKNQVKVIRLIQPSKTYMAASGEPRKDTSSPALFSTPRSPYATYDFERAQILPKQIKQGYRFVDKKTGKKEFAVTAKIMGDDGIERVQLYDLSTAKRLPDLFAYDELFAKFEAK